MPRSYSSTVEMRGMVEAGGGETRKIQPSILAKCKPLNSMNPGVSLHRRGLLAGYLVLLG